MKTDVVVTEFDAAEYLTDEEMIAEYLNACAELGDPALLLSALSDVARARGMSALARESGLGRESLYKALSPGAQPRYETIFRVAQALGVPMRFGGAARAVPDKTTAKPHARSTPAEKRAAAMDGRRAVSRKRAD